MADQDHQVAVDLSRTLNANPRRISPRLAEREMRAAKRPRISDDLVTQLMPPSTPPQAAEAPTLPSMLPSNSPPAIDIVQSTTPDAGSSPLSSIQTPLSFSSQFKTGLPGALMESVSSDEAIEVRSPQPRTRKQRGKKQDEGSDEFLPSHNIQDNPANVSQPGKTSKRPKAAEKRKTVPVKTPNTPYHVNNQVGKPEPHGQPGVWADKRQQLCETVPYYKAYQGSAYTNDNKVFALLIDKEVAVRDKFEEEIIITSVGGGRSVDENGKRVRKQDQPKRKAEPFLNSMKRNIPIVVIAGQGNTISPSKLPHVYNVLDWFHITDVWGEKGVEGFATWKVRLEKICLTQKSWWAAQGSPALSQDPVAAYEKTHLVTCTHCGTSSKFQYNAGWACLDTECKSFFKFENGYNDGDLDYNDNFMKERTSYQGADPGPLSSPLPTDQDMAQMDAYGYEKAFKRGIVCPKCGCCSRRIVWDHWYCENADCDFTYTLKQKTMPINEVIAKAMDKVDKGSLSDQLDAEFARGVRKTHSIHSQWTINEYAIPDDTGEVIGFVRHFKSDGIINQQKDGPNDLFKQMQSGEFALRRNPARQADGVGEMLTSHFAANFGAKYKYGVKQLSTSFDQAPDVILKTVKRLTWAGCLTVSNNLESFGLFEPFNECLSIGYFEGSRINYHDDGEKTLGPTVATLSLGAPARMLFRPKSNNTIGKTEAKEKPAVLQFTLEHGDIVIMHGPKIQKFYEHAVIPWGFRFALTCRFIRAELMGTEKEQRDAIAEGTLPSRVEQYTYNGDLDATEIIPSATEVDKHVNYIATKLKTGHLTTSQVWEIKAKLAGLISSSNTELEQAFEGPRDVAMLDAL